MKKILVIGVVLICLILTFIIVLFCKKNTHEIINDNKIAHIVFTSDKQYKDYLLVTLKSAIVNKKPDTIYDIHILGINLDDNEMNEFKNMETTNVKITPQRETLESIKTVGQFEVANHVSRADLFKFYFPEIFKDFDKILYIDSDTLIVKDLLELYNIDLKNTYLGAVYNYKCAYDWQKHLFGLFWTRKSIYSYNCGVMLYNLKKMRQDNIPEKLIASKNADERRVLMTQAAFNEVIPTKTITKLSPIYNMIVRWRPIDFKLCDFKKMYSPSLKNINSMDELWTESVIIHFAGRNKPWNDKEINFGKEWWGYAKLLNKEIKMLPMPTMPEMIF